MRSKLLLSFLCILFTINGYAEESLSGNYAQNEITSGEEQQLFQAQTVISYHEVCTGETLYRISRENDVSIEDLKIWNNLTSNNIIAGSKLKIQKTEFVPIEQPALAEPEIQQIAVNDKAMEDIMADYVLQIEDAKYNSKSYRKQVIDEKLVTLAESNMQNMEVKPKANIWNRLSGATNTAFTSVKGWGKSVIGKNDNIEMTTETFLAENAVPVENIENPEDSNIPVDYRVEIEKLSNNEIKPDPILITRYPDDTGKKNKNIWNKISNTANTAFHSVKDFGKSIKGGKNEKEKKQEFRSGEYLAEEIYLMFNTTQITGITLKISDIEKDNPIYSLPEMNDHKKVLHKVRIGETMTQIASRYNVSQTDIVKWNNLSSNIVNVKHRLVIFVPKDSNLAHHRAKTETSNIN